MGISVNSNAILDTTPLLIVTPPAPTPDTAADVPGKFDVVIDGHGYVFWNALMQSLPFRNQRAAYYYYPTFLERTNVSGAYGDETQSFWLTASQNDWSEGAGRRYFRSADADLIRRYWSSNNLDTTSIPGQVTLNPDMDDTIAFSEAIYGACSDGGVDGSIFSVSATTLYFIQVVVGASYIIGGLGVHGCGNSPELWGLAHDGNNLFLSSTKSSTVGVRKWDGSSFSTFSAQPADSLAFLNNTLFGYKKSNSTLYTYDTSGAATSSFTWKAADGGTLASQGMVAPFGGQLLILRYSKNTELWQYDGTGVQLQTDFPDDFIGKEICVVSGIVFISGLVNQGGNYYPHIFYYVGNQLGQLWQATSSVLTNANQYPTMAPYGSGIVFTDDSTGSVFQYDIALGGVHDLGSTPVTTDPAKMASGPAMMVIARNRAPLTWFPDIVPASSGSLVTSLFDFENSLLKVPRGVKVEFDTDGDSSVDIAYQYDSVEGAFTTLRSGAVSGVEYVLPTTRCHSIAIKVTLNLNTSTVGPTLKRIFVRAAPLLTTYRRVEYDLDLTGATSVGGVMENAVPLRNGNFMPRTGLQQALALKASMTAQVPIVITDRLGTFTGVFEQGPEVSEFDEVRPGEFIAKITLREV